jgi:hypothetical protein
VIGFLTSRIGLVLGTVAVCATLHFIDRGYAVRSATRGMVEQFEAEAAKAEATRLLKLTAITQKLNNDLEAQKAQADLSLAALEKEIQDYESQNSVGADCVVTDRLLERLR